MAHSPLFPLGRRVREVGAFVLRSPLGPLKGMKGVRVKILEAPLGPLKGMKGGDELD